MTITTLPLDTLLTSTSKKDFSARRALSDVSTAIAKCKKAVVITGAGISCSSGIPDFRSSDGLYSLVKDRYPDAFVTGKDLFSSGLFTHPTTTSLFYTFIAELALSCQKAQPTPTHHFIARLEHKGKLLRSYTQNIDGLERRMGLECGGRGNGLKKRGTRNVEMHGDLGRVRCVLCMSDFEALDHWMEMFREGDAPDCPACSERSSSRVARSARALPIGTLRPAIVLYDEPHPLGEEIGSLQAYDLTRSPDLLLIMGTSLKVHGLKKVVKAFAKAVHAKGGLVVFVNATPPSKEWEGVIDVHVQGQTDTWVARVEEEWKKIRPQDWQLQTKLSGKIVKEGDKAKAKGKGKAGADEDDVKDKPVPLQLPTPRNSQSPSQASARTQQAEDPTVIDAPPTPLSPSKRRANVPPSPVSEDDASPSKRQAVSLQAPFTGLPATPGGGNLFAPSKDTLNISDQWEDVEENGNDEEVFGSPIKKMAADSASKKTASSGKENVKPKSVPGGKPPSKAAVVKVSARLASRRTVNVSC